MAESKYEKYVIRNPRFLEVLRREDLTGTGTNPPMNFVNGDIPLKGVNQYIDVGWIWAPPPPEAAPSKSQVHDFDEIFMYIGNNPADPTDLGGEIELWLGAGEDRERVTFDTSTLIYIPKGLWHLPIVYKRIDRPILHIVIGINSGQWAAILEGGEKFSVA